jgi:hypothetical protein
MKTLSCITLDDSRVLCTTVDWSKPGQTDTIHVDDTAAKRFVDTHGEAYDIILVNGRTLKNRIEA